MTIVTPPNSSASADVNPVTTGNPTEHPNGSSVPPNPPALLADPSLLDAVARVMRERGFAGDPAPAVLAYVALTSRLLDRPTCLAFIGPSAVGKNRVVEAAMDLVPNDAYHHIHAGSSRSLIYGDVDLRHKAVIYGEADSIPDEGTAASAIRSLISDGRLHYEVAEQQTNGKYKTRRIDKEGPTGLITTSTRSIAYQLGTRLLEIPLTDSEEQTREILRAQGRAAEGEAKTHLDVTPFVEAQVWLQRFGGRRVIVPFARALAELVPVSNVRMNRDFPQLLTTIKTLALLHQCNRERTADGAIVASLDDYATARRLLGPVFDAVAADGLTPAVKRTVEAVRPGEEISLTDLATRLQRRKSTVSDHVNRATRRGWLVNSEARSGLPAKLSRGEPLPEIETSLPTVEKVREVFGCSVPNPVKSRPQSVGRAAMRAALRRSRVEQLADVSRDTGGMR